MKNLPSMPHMNKYDFLLYPKIGLVSEINPYMGFINQGIEDRP